MCSGERVRREAMGTSQPRAGTHSSGMFSGPILTVASEPRPSHDWLKIPWSRSSWERVAGLLQTPVPSAEAHSVLEGLLYTACPGSGWARAFLYPGGSGSWEPTGAPLLGTAVVFSLLMLGPGPTLPPSPALAHLFPRASLPRSPRV